MLKRGKFITLEGGEGAGKSTNIPCIQAYLASRQVAVVMTREPGGTEIAEKIRQLLLNKTEEAITSSAELLLIFAARAQHLAHVIEPALAKGQWVLCDRFTDATYAYQGGGRQMPLDQISWLENFVQGQLRPDLTLLLDLSVEVGMARAKSRKSALDRFELEQVDFFTRIRECYLEQARHSPERIKIIQADQALEQVQSDILKALEPLLA